MSSSHLCSTAVGGLRSGAIGRRVTRRASSAVATQGLRLCVCMARGTEEDESVNRRRTLLSLPALALAIRVAGAATAEVLEQEPVEDTAPQVSSSRKVVVLGGNGFVGSRVCKLLVQAGCDVVSVSRSGLPPSWAAGKEDWVSRVTWTKVMPLRLLCMFFWLQNCPRGAIGLSVPVPYTPISKQLSIVTVIICLH